MAGYLPRGIPDSFVEAVRVMQHVDRELCNMEADLSYGLRLKDLDPGLQEDMQYVRRTLGTVKPNLSVMEIAARSILSDQAKSKPPKRGVELAAKVGAVAAMIDDTNLGKMTDEEVAFWRGFIEWWAREQYDPLPPMAWEALARAERKWPHDPAVGCGALRITHQILS